MSDPRLVERALVGLGGVGPAGIDYGLGKANIDHGTGIRYGVLPQNDCLQAWCDSSEAFYGSPVETVCPKCDTQYILRHRKKGWNWGDSFYCRKCQEHFDVDFPDCAEPLSFYVDDGEYLAEAGEDGDIFIMKSPYFTFCEFCSPCAPGAGYLRSPIKGGVKAYCFGHDWFEDDSAPYPVYSVETGEEVMP